MGGGWAEQREQKQVEEQRKWRHEETENTQQTDKEEELVFCAAKISSMWFNKKR